MRDRALADLIKNRIFGRQGNFDPKILLNWSSFVLLTDFISFSKFSSRMSVNWDAEIAPSLLGITEACMLS
jgi:hypothetical protein